MPLMTRLVAVVLIVMGAAGGLLLSRRIASGEVFVGPGEFVQMAAVTVPSVEPAPCTTSNVFDFVPDTAVTFRTDQAAPAVILFSTGLLRQTGAPARIRFRFLVDTARGAVVWAVPLGATPGPPGPTTGRANFHFVTDPLLPGTHVIAVQWSSQSAGQELCLGRRDLIVFHK